MEDDDSRSAEPPSPGATEPPLSILLLDDGGLLGPERCAWVDRHALAALASLTVGEVRVRVVGDGPMAEAHRRWAGVGGTTDVLTFDLRDPGDGPLDVDLLVCFDEAARQASARGHGPEREVLLYIVHGVLHCLGYDDHDEAGAERMHAEEDRLLGLAGVGPVYARPAAGAER
jgi:probable rRNA maturation factor